MSAFRAAHATAGSWTEACKACVEQLGELDEAFNLGFIYVTDALAPELAGIVGFLQAPALGASPHAVILELGGNDGLRGLDPEETYKNLAAILARLQERNIPVLLAGMYAPPNLGLGYGREFKAVFPRLAERFGVPLYPFFLEGVAAEPALNQKDGLHPNGRGVEVIVERILPFVERLVLQTR